MREITIVSCNYNTKLFAELLVKSVKKFSSDEHRILILDNSEKQELFSNKDYEVIISDRSKAHGPGLDYLIDHIHTEFGLILDIDTHILRKGYDTELLNIMNNHSDIGLIAPERNCCKPIHPAVMLFRKETIQKVGAFFHPVRFMHPDLAGYAMDVGQFVPMALAYNKLRTYTLKRVTTASVYKDTRGDVWSIGKNPAFFHFGYSRSNDPKILELRDNMMNQID